MKFGAIAVIIGVIVVIIGFAAPTMQIAGEFTGQQPNIQGGALTASQSVYTPGSVIPLTFTWTFIFHILHHSQPLTYWFVVYPHPVTGITPTTIQDHTQLLFTKTLTTENGSYTFDFTNTHDIGTYDFYVSAYEPSIQGRSPTLLDLGSVYVNVNNTIVSSTPPSQVIIQNISATPNPAKVNDLVSFTATLLYEGVEYPQVRGITIPITWEVNGSSPNDFSRVSTSTGAHLTLYNTYIFYDSGIYTITAIVTSPLNNSLKYYDSFQLVVYPNYATPPNVVKPPVINAVSGSPNPGLVGNYVTFNASVNWYNQVGSVLWEVNGVTHSGNHFAFVQTGTYTITAIAKNSYGSTFKTFTEVINANPISVVKSVSGSPNPAQVGETVTFSGDVNWNGPVGSTVWQVNGQTISGNSYIFNSVGTYTVTLVATSSEGSSSNSFNEVVNPVSTPPPGPIIESAFGTPNPVTVGQTVTFTGNVEWSDHIGTLTWEINGQAISGDTYTFNKAITYTITAVATNNIGTTTNSFSEVVNPVSTTTLKNIGTFYMVANGKIYELNGRANVNITTVKYNVPATIYYVENNGTTQGLSGITINVNSNSYVLKLTNTTNYDGHTAYSMALNFESGNYTLTGYLHETSKPTSIQAFSLEVNNLAPATPATPLQQATSHFTSEINYTAIIVGIIIMIGGVVLIRFGI